MKVAKEKKNDSKESWMITSESNICREVVIYHRSRLNLQVYIWFMNKLNISRNSRNFFNENLAILL